MMAMVTNSSTRVNALRFIGLLRLLSVAVMITGSETDLNAAFIEPKVYSTEEPTGRPSDDAARPPILRLVHVLVAI